MFKRKPHPAEGREALWNLLSGSTIRGVLVKEAGPKLILRAASVYEPGREWVAADGEVIIDAANVDYVQVP
ncbi:hypothetical protein [Mycobacteroides abscessus]|uniref:hypothetical protein n=1 Tax=Mycobacteroides abscessus TaxID=36809 RepID=UPI0005E78B52|nr:hypothetical protein [Mycobacteroides abscessus]CPR79307.1 Uncharacterised protein [Mycobacteroides abscessus]CPR88458.1 Uncharacterised protein [Mycobacteroides abscessus]CPS43397.1 Uncharacterised protein [Mycobacteroides abscessus]CPV03187.1 Uncharacterised protein [Mycobacteroides abscessus]